NRRLVSDWSSDVCSSDPPQPAPAPGEYADAIIAHLRQQLEPVNTLRVAGGQPPWPPLPASCMDREAPPCERLLKAIEYARDLVQIGRASCRERVEMWGVG